MSLINNIVKQYLFLQSLSTGKCAAGEGGLSEACGDDFNQRNMFSSRMHPAGDSGGTW